MDFITLLCHRLSLKRVRAARVRLHLELLEARNLLSVDVKSTFPGLSSNDDPRYEPPDTIAAVGPDHVVEMVNGTVAFYDKATGSKLFQSTFERFFGDLNFPFDPVVVYDELRGRFVLAAPDFNSVFNVAFSRTSDPTEGFIFKQYNMDDEFDGVFDFADYPRIGYNADAYVISFNMFPFGFDHVDTLSIDKNTLAGHRVIVPGGTFNFTMAPATMHGSQPGDSMWFVESAGPSGGITINVVQMSNVLSDTPTFTTTSLAVPTYFFTPGAVQAFSAILIRTDDDRIINSAMASRQIFAAHSVGTFDATGFVAHVRWYQFDTTGDAPILVQMGELDQGSGVYTYYPSIEINTVGDLGMTFMQSSNSEYMSMYVTGRKNTDPVGTMQRPALTHAGRAAYLGFRAGDYSGITVDPVDGTTFWAANEYKANPFANGIWSTGIASFSISSASPPPGPGSPKLAPALGIATLSPESAGTAEATPSSLPTTAFAPTPTARSVLDVPVVDRLFSVNMENQEEVISLGLSPRSPGEENSGWTNVKAEDGALWDGSLPL